MYFDYNSYSLKVIPMDILRNATILTDEDRKIQPELYNFPFNTSNRVDANIMVANYTENEILPLLDENNLQFNRPLTPCSNNENTSFMDYYNDYLDYNSSTKLSNKDIVALKINSFCISDNMQAYPTEQKSSYSVKYGIRIPKLFIHLLKKNLNYQYIMTRVYYQKLFINTDPHYYENQSYHRNVWKFTDIVLDETAVNFYNLKIQKTLIETDKTRFIFNAIENNITYTIENFDQVFSLTPYEKMNDFACSITFEINLYVKNINIKYTSLDDIIGLFLATFEVFSIFSVYLFGYILGPFYLSSLINNVFNFHENKYNSEEINKYFESLELINVGDINTKKRKNNTQDQKLINKNEEGIEIIKINSVKSYSNTETNERLNKKLPIYDYVTSIKPSKKEVSNNELLYNFNEYKNESLSKSLEVENKSISINDIDQVSIRKIEQESPANVENSKIKYSKTNSSATLMSNSNLNIGKDELLNDLKEKYKSRVVKKVTPIEIFLLDYCHCCTNPSPKLNLVNEVREYIEKCFEVSKIVTNMRETDFLKTILLKENQRRLYYLPSLNTNTDNNVNLDLNFNRDDETNELPDDIKEIHGLKYDEEIVEYVQEADFYNFTSKRLIKNMIESII